MLTGTLSGTLSGKLIGMMIGIALGTLVACGLSLEVSAQDAVTSRYISIGAGARRGSTTRIDSLAQIATRLLEIRWFDGGQAPVEVDGCHLALGAARTDGKVRVLTTQRFDVAFLSAEASAIEHDSPTMTSAVHFRGRDGNRFVITESERVVGQGRGIIQVDTVDFVTIGVALGDPKKELAAIRRLIGAFAEACALAGPVP